MCDSVKCPNGCLISTGLTSSFVVPRTYDMVTGETGTRNYCEQCGEELVETEESTTTIIA